MSMFEGLLIQERCTGKQYDLSQWPNMDEATSKLLHARGATSESCEYLWKDLPSPNTLKDMQGVLERLATALALQQRIVIVGDYDSDGATSISIMLKGMSKLGFKHVFYVVPHRFIHGYGLTDVLIPSIMTHAPDLIVTVDNGIQSVDSVKKLKDSGVDVIITDHHLPGPVLPDALIINPNQPDCKFVDKHLAGCGVAWYIMVALRSHLKLQLPHAINFNDLTIYAAIGTVADCVKLTSINRVIIQHGLNLMRSGKAPRGMAELMKVAKISYDKLTSVDIAFRLAPRLNAAGRLEDMSLGVQCLMSDQLSEAQSYAHQLNELNSQRQTLQASMQTKAFDMLKAGQSAGVIYDESWHQGIVGLIASKAREHIKRPVIAFAWDERKGCYKGSGRSIPSVNMKHILDDISCDHPDLMLNFGGHSAAVGLSVSASTWPLFASIFVKACSKYIPDDYQEVDVWHDGWIKDECLNSDWFKKLYMSHPFGMGFEEPIYLAKLIQAKSSVTKGGHVKIDALTPTSGHEVTVWMFHNASRPMGSELPEGSIEIVCQYLSGDRRLSLKALAWREAAA